MLSVCSAGKLKLPLKTTPSGSHEHLITVLSQKVPGVIGGSVVLPCSSTEPDQDTEVHWRQNGSKIVYDIIKGEDSVEQQDPRYKNRAETFPEEYKRGNFSIKLNDLQHTDAGKYMCLIAHSSEHKTVELIINGVLPLTFYLLHLSHCSNLFLSFILFFYLCRANNRKWN
uniref:Ig-like domain-containing protein n=1 Tax=Sinocyclocheilus grahami TaxID=75366 RepID=A0A672L7Y7_SINGR